MNNMWMKVFFFLTAIAVVASIYLSYQRTIVRKDFETFDSEAETEEPSEQLPGEDTSTSTASDEYGVETGSQEL